MTEEQEIYQVTNSREAQAQAAYGRGDVDALYAIVRELMDEQVQLIAENIKLSAQVAELNVIISGLSLTLVQIENATRCARLFGDAYGGK